MLAWSFTLWPVVLLGLLLTGIGIGVHWPLGVARVVRASGGMTDRASAAASIAGSISIAIAPFALGTLSDTIGFQWAFLLVPLFLAIALVILVIRPVPDAVTHSAIAITPAAAASSTPTSTHGPRTPRRSRER